MLYRYNSVTGSLHLELNDPIGAIAKQYSNGSSTEVWFKEGTVGAGSAPNK